MNAVLPRDACLPQLARALDAQVMAEVFAAQLGGLQVLGCEVERIKYRPARNCTVAYRLRLHDPRQGRRFEQRVAARFCTGGEAARRCVKSSARTLVASAAGPTLTHVPELDMVAHWWPNDAKLEAPQLLLDDAELRRRCLDEVVEVLTAGRWRLVDHRTTIVQAVPDLRVCARVELRLQRPCGGATRTQAVYAKADLERSGADVQTLMQALSDSEAQAAGRLHTPRPLLWQAQAGLHWQQGLPGRALEDVEPQLGPAISAHIGRRLAALHDTPVPTEATKALHTLRAQVVQAVHLLEQVQPAWQPVLHRLARRLDVGAAALAGEVAVTLHGDLHPRNILVDGAQQLAFIDLDSVCRGPAVIELGGWVADLHYRAMLAGQSAAHTTPAVDAFLAAYAQASGDPAPAALLAWSAAHHLLCKRAYRGVANLKPGRFEAVPRLLALADAMASAGSVQAPLLRTLEAA
jgi:aminoglycoside phosphotransferase